jgi:diaminopimelate decarboxylase
MFLCVPSPSPSPSPQTQPHRAVLAAAKAAQYCAECISLAEVYAAIDAGFPVEEIVLTGPGKFYDIVPKGERILQGPLRAIFADSLSDLKEIVARVLDPCDWLDCATIGVRWMPAWHVRSRFGLDPKDMKLVLAVAEIISALPADKGVGMHFHFASSTLGADTWFGLAKAFCHFSAGFVSLIHRPITAIDFGGGWSPYFYVEGSEDGVLESTNKKLSSILQSVCTEFEAVQSTLPSVQFEPGKCISEAAGGIITRILSIREVPHEGQASDSPESEDMEKDKENQVGRAFIVDTCIAEISSPHIHPVFWKSKNLQSDSTADVWLPLPPGDDVIWGRTCMEFDIIHGSFSLPSTAQPGDFLLYAATGSYDFTNSYDFGDGIARSMTLL